MNRKDFLRITCSVGICACAIPGILSSNEALAQSTEEEPWQVRFSKDRF